MCAAPGHIEQRSGLTGSDAPHSQVVWILLLSSKDLAVRRNRVGCYCWRERWPRGQNSRPPVRLKDNNPRRQRCRTKRPRRRTSNNQKWCGSGEVSSFSRGCVWDLLTSRFTECNPKWEKRLRFIFFLFLSPLVIIKKKRGIGREKGETEGASLKFGGRFKRSFSCVDSLRSV